MTTEQTPKKKQPFLIVVMAVILIAGIVFGYKKISYSMQNEDTENSQLQTNIVPVSPRIGGYVAAVYVADNQQVKKGDTLVVLDDRDLKIKVEQAMINLENAKANVAVVKSNVNTADAGATATATSIATAAANVATAKASVDAAKVRVWQTTEDFKRYEKLFAQTSATQQQYDAAKAQKEAAEQQLKVAEKQVEVAQAQLATAKQQSVASSTQASGVSTQVQVAELLIKQRQAELDMAQLQLSYAYILAPFDGYISKKNVQVGQLLSPGQTICSVVDETTLWVVANFKETQIADMHTGQKVEVKVDAYPKEKFEGKVESIQAATGSTFSLLPADNATGNFVKVVQRIPVKIVLEKTKFDNAQLRAGMNVTVAVKVK
ncbi:MAG TPA: HlyD family secretion protein [Chitinophagales bacterium]|jgi:membrane fusion protein (multidrug efflux system)|nr:HlyD family secretion protein [Chitinophagales bacterium]HQO31722.1 HlyD family secretion protein [Chitinophagales bacterium]